MDDLQTGELIGKVNAIKDNTDKIPQFAITLALHEARISAIEPMVQRHEKTTQRAFGIATLAGTIAGIFAAWRH